MPSQQYDSAVDLLLAFWRGKGPEGRSARDVCRLLADKVLSRLSPGVARSVPGDASLHATEIGIAVTELVHSDPEARVLVESLTLEEQAMDVQRVSVSGEHTVVVTAGRDIQGLDVQVLSQALDQIGPRPTDEALRDEASLDRLRQLRRILVTRFDQGELHTLCFELGIDYDDLPGEGKADKARELIGYLDRHDQIQRLVIVGRQLRPDISSSDT